MRRGTGMLGDKKHVMELVEQRCWTSSDGRTRHVASMDTPHIRNAIRWVERNADEIAANQLLVAMFEDELERRGADVPASMEMEDRWRKLCMITRDLFTYYRKSRGPQHAQRYKEMLEAIGVDVR